MMAAASNPEQVPDGHPLRGYGLTTWLMNIPGRKGRQGFRHPQAWRADVLRASARHKEVAPMTDKISQRLVPPLDPPERFAGGETVAASRCPVDVSTYPRRHVIVVRHAGEHQTFSEKQPGLQVGTGSVVPISRRQVLGGRPVLRLGPSGTALSPYWPTLAG